MTTPRLFRRGMKTSMLVILLLALLACPDQVGGNKKASKSKIKGKGMDQSAARSVRGKGEKCDGLAGSELSNFDRLLQRAAELSQSRALDHAQACLESALELASNVGAEAHVMFNLAVVARQRGDIEGAKKILLQAPKEGVKNWAPAHTFLGTLLLESGEPRQALESLSRAKKLLPQEPVIYRWALSSSAVSLPALQNILPGALMPLAGVLRPWPGVLRVSSEFFGVRQVLAHVLFRAHPVLTTCSLQGHGAGLLQSWGAAYGCQRLGGGCRQHAYQQ